ncbi:hypothetical protein Sa4125_37530 [Aureimonas sp. SA4125]|uniref:copper chaperone PCu(A)C n=1 Tax=Aureimonas sp. SA4125 TaxID=2826993 RepID=UPI001CC4A767|nr:copper chaperone PCu(A)C [Aureimonas sp. SA4125]BDA86211.1 hypothetical protein Sa4125_37530 [Aureimonas sp. SA4125]
MLRNFRTPRAALAVILLCSGARAEDAGHATAAGDLKIVHAWTRAADAGSDALVFMEIENAGPADRLMGGRSARAGSVTVVGLTIVDGDVATTATGPVDVPPGEIELDPGGLALELRDLGEPLVVGSEMEVILTFERAGDVVIPVEVEAIDARQHSHAGHEH